MAMRIAQLGRNIRCHAHKFSTSAKAISSESTPLSQIPGLPPAATLLKAFRCALSVSGYASYAACCYWFGLYDLRKEYADWKTEKKVQKMLEKLESAEQDSAQAYLVELDREVDALKVKLSNRHANVLELSFFKREADMLNLDINEREVSALKEKLFQGGFPSKFHKVSVDGYPELANEARVEKGEWNLGGFRN